MNNKQSNSNSNTSNNDTNNNNLDNIYIEKKTKYLWK